MEREGILTSSTEGFLITQMGRIFIRNIASIFDMRLNKQKTEEEIFSKAI
jgi:hypothetical protein